VLLGSGVCANKKNMSYPQTIGLLLLIYKDGRTDGLNVVVCVLPMVLFAPFSAKNEDSGKLN
jgi:hypothetical protein